MFLFHKMTEEELNGKAEAAKRFASSLLFIEKKKNTLRVVEVG